MHPMYQLTDFCLEHGNTQNQANYNSNADAWGMF